MTKFFPIPANVSGLHTATGGYERWGGQKKVRNEARWHEIGRERDIARITAMAWRSSAVADGWREELTYPLIGLDHAVTLKLFMTPPLYFKCYINTKPNDFTGDNWTLGDGSVKCFGTDGLDIRVPLIYPGKQYFIDALTTCPKCNAHPVATMRYSFTGRTCKECLPAMQEKHERVGWND